MKIQWLRVVATEIFKTVNNLNPNYIKNIFTPKLHPSQGKVKWHPGQTP